MKLKVTNECIMCGACTVVEDSKFEMDNKVIPNGDYSKEKAKEIIEICPVDAILEA
jgi:ferredoxin